MVFPPVVPPNNRTNATDMVDSHVSDHNALADALTALMPTVWAALPLGPNIAAYAGTNQRAEYRREQGDVVRVRGWFQRASGNMANGDLLGTLPAGFRPPYGLEYAVSYSGQVSVIGVGTDGTLKVLFPSATANALTIAITFGIVPP